MNGKITFRNGNFTVYTDNNGKCVVNVWQQGILTENVTTLTPSITFEGKASFVKMKSSWTYFKEIKCMADILKISGKVSFNVPNTFDTRIYATNFSYSGKYTAYPEPAYIRTDYIKTQIDDYQRENFIGTWSVVTTPIGIGWILINIFILVFALLRKEKGRFLRKFQNN